MTSSVVALSTLNLAGLRLLSAIGSFAGLAMILLGLLFDRKVRHPSQEPHSEPAGPSAYEPSPAESSAPQEVIHLSENSGLTKSSEMSQQQKIAAALTRAGIANSAGWSTPPPARAASAVMDPPLETSIAEDRNPDRIPISVQSALTRRLILLSGSMLLLLSLILFLAIR